MVWYVALGLAIVSTNSRARHLGKGELGGIWILENMGIGAYS